jgi:hypothetical protein
MRLVVLSLTLGLFGVLSFTVGLCGAAAVSSLQSGESDHIQSQRSRAQASTRWCPPHPDSAKADVDPRLRMIPPV